MSFGTTMRTPGDDESLAAGLLYGEGIVNQAADIDAIESSTRRPNVVNVRLHSSVRIVPNTPSRLFSAGSSCGVCGTTGLDAAIARAAATHIPDTGHASNCRCCCVCRTGCARRSRSSATPAAFTPPHCSIFRASCSASRRMWAATTPSTSWSGMSLMSGALPLANRIVVLSGRASFELVQKAMRAGVSVLAAIGAPSSLAVNLAVTSGSDAGGISARGALQCIFESGAIDARPARSAPMIIG